MGAQLVGKAFVYAATHGLKPNETRLLLWMALTALDSDQPPRYFAAREESAFGLGHRIADRTTADARAIAARASAFQLVKVALQGLVASGAIERLERGRAGRRAEYALTFGKGALPLEGNPALPHSGKPSFPSAGSLAYPQGTTYEPSQELPGRTPQLDEEPHLSPVENPKQERS